MHLSPTSKLGYLFIGRYVGEFYIGVHFLISRQFVADSKKVFGICMLKARSMIVLFQIICVSTIYDAFGGENVTVKISIVSLVRRHRRSNFLTLAFKAFSSSTC